MFVARSSIPALLIVLAGCGALFGEASPTEGTHPGVQPSEGYPDVVRWGRPLATVQDAEQGETRTVVRSPEGDVWAKVHHPPDQLDIVTRIDVRRRGTDGAWRYETWDPATLAPIALDAEPCHLCHSMAPQDQTWTALKERAGRAPADQ
jgi:hypothetical protein